MGTPIEGDSCPELQENSSMTGPAPHWGVPIPGAGNGVASRRIWQSSTKAKVSKDLRARISGGGAKLRNANVKAGFGSAETNGPLDVLKMH